MSGNLNHYQKDVLTKFLSQGLLVSSTTKSDFHIALPNTFSWTTSPVNVNDAPTPSILKKRKQLHQIFEHLPETTAVSIGLLIGWNCPCTFESLSTILIRNGGPYAIKCRLEWCVAGPMDVHKMNSMFSVTKLNSKTMPPIAIYVSNMLHVKQTLFNTHILDCLSRIWLLNKVCLTCKI